MSYSDFLVLLERCMKLLSRNIDRNPETLQMVKGQFNSTCKQQQVKGEPSKLSYNNFLFKAENYKRNAFKDLKNHIEWRITRSGFYAMR